MAESRRQFLKSMVGGASLVSLSGAAPWTLRQAAALAAAGPPSDTVLVALQLSGGNDGLNMVVPYGDDAYGRARRTLRLTAAQVRRIDGLLGLHPEMTACRELLAEGRLSIVQGVGHAGSSRSHGPAMRDWHTARPGDAACQTGWLGRAGEAAALGDARGLTAVQTAPIPPCFALSARTAFAPRIPDIGRWMGPSRPDRPPERPGPPDDNPLLARAQTAARTACDISRRLDQVLRDARGGSPYPPFGLARQLKTAAELIRAQVGVRIILAELGGGGIGGFDTHANQRDNHAALLRQLSQSLAAFADDLDRAGALRRTLLMTYSEFGRTLSENGRRGTGHGAAAPVLLVGGSLRGGLIGRHPDLTDLDADAPKPLIDYRSLYAAVLDQWLGVDSRAVLGREFPQLDLAQREQGVG